MSNTKVFFDMEIGGDKVGKILMELFTESDRKVVENFRALCTGEKGMGRSGKPLHYKGSIFHRVIPGFICHGGDFINGDGTGGESIYGGDDYFAGENHVSNSRYTTGPGIVVMSKNNGSQFFICTGKTDDWLDEKKHVVIGRVVEGMDVVRMIEKVGSSSGTTKKRVVIADCGQL